MIWTSAEGEFWIKNWTIPSGMDEDPSLNANLASINVLDNLTVPFIFYSQWVQLTQGMEFNIQ